MQSRRRMRAFVVLAKERKPVRRIIIERCSVASIINNSGLLRKINKTQCVFLSFDVHPKKNAAQISSTRHALKAEFGTYIRQHRAEGRVYFLPRLTATGLRLAKTKSDASVYTKASQPHSNPHKEAASSFRRFRTELCSLVKGTRLSGPPNMAALPPKSSHTGKKKKKDLIQYLSKTTRGCQRKTRKIQVAPAHWLSQVPFPPLSANCRKVKKIKKKK